jgi:hypothetical protein
MKTLSQTSSLLFGAIIYTFTQAEAHAHAHEHEVRSPADVFPAVENDAALLEARDDDSYGGKDDHSGNGGWKAMDRKIMTTGMGKVEKDSQQAQ